MLKTSLTFAAVATIAALTGCAATPAAPFDQLKTANLTAYRLQNADPSATAATPGATPAPALTIPGLPPEMNAWIQQGAAGLSAVLPGLLPGAAAAALPQPDTTPRFHDFRILSQTQVLDPDLKDSLGKLLGDKDSFDNADSRCAANVFYADLGLSFTSNVGATPNDLLISFQCNQVVSRSFAWPHPATGMKPDTVKKLSEIVLKIFPQGT
jgi:hypothetical protein